MSLVQSILTGSAIVMKTEFNVDRSKYMNASEALNCIRMQFYEKSKTKGEPQDWGYANRGKIIEAFIVDCLKAANVPLAFAGDEQQSIVCDETMISSTPDAVIAWGEGKNEGLEIKSIDPRTNRSKLPKKAHVVQLKIAMALLNKNSLDFNGIKKGTLLYVDASNIHDILEFEVEADDGILERMAPRAKLLLTTRKADKLEREGKTTDDGCKYCAYTKVCGVQGAVAAKPAAKAKGNRGSKLHDTGKQYTVIGQQIEMLTAERKELSEGIKAELHKRDVTKITVGDIDIVLIAVKGRASLDKKAVKKAGIDLSPFQTTGAPSERLTVTVHD